MADLVADALDLSDAEVSDLLQATPFLNALPVEKSSNGETHKYSKETAAPVIAFRDPNVGREMKSSADTVVTNTLKILDFSWDVDKAIADVWRKGGKEAMIAREGMRHVKAAMVTFEKAIIYGTTATHGVTGSFSGMIQQTSVDALADALTIDAAGTTAATASSAWAVRIGPNDVTAVVNGDGAISLGETTVQQKYQSADLTYPVYYTPGCTWVGAQFGSIYSMGRVVNVTEDSGKGLTDILLAKLLEQFPTDRFPTHFVMNRRSLRQLQASRTATNPTGSPAPFPSESFGVPIIVTDSIASTEVLVA